MPGSGVREKADTLVKLLNDKAPNNFSICQPSCRSEPKFQMPKGKMLQDPAGRVFAMGRASVFTLYEIIHV